VVKVDRIRKVEIDLKREISFIINNKIKDPRIGFVTITDTKLSPDYKWLDVFFSVMGDDEEISSSLKVLDKCCGFIKRSLPKKLRLKNIPNIRFLYDKSIDEGMRISNILDTLDKGDRDQKGD
jgi:ribosome-binding factor A